MVDTGGILEYALYVVELACFSAWQWVARSASVGRVVILVVVHVIDAMLTLTERPMKIVKAAALSASDGAFPF